MVKMIITDLDQTMLRNDGSISDYTKDILAECKKREILLGVATARSMVNAVHLQELLGAEVLICSNGSRVMYEGKLIDSVLLDADTVCALTDGLQKLASMEEILMEGDDQVYINTYRFKPPHPYAKAHHTDFVGGMNKAAFQVFAGIGNKEEAQSIRKRFPDCRCLNYRDSSRYAFMAKEVSKKNALLRTAEKLKIPISEVAAFGDDEGDIEMLRACGMGIAMGNALECVKEVSFAVTKTNEEDGAAWFIEHHIL